MTASKARRLARLDELKETVDQAQATLDQARGEAARISSELLAEGVSVPEIAEHGPYSAPWLRGVRNEMKRRGEIQ